MGRKKKDPVKEKNDQLLDEFQSNRHKIYDMIADLEQYVSDVKDLMPKKEDKQFRNRYEFENRLKTVTEFFKIIFDMRKEIGKLIKDEISITNKLSVDNEDKLEDIHKTMSDLDKYFKKATKKVTSLEEELEELEDDN